MQHYTLIFFAWDDDIIATSTLRADTLDQAHRMAEHIQQTQRQAAGYQLWQDGQRLLSTYPAVADPATTPIAVLARQRWRTAG